MWKNGGGTTTELLRLPDGNSEDFLLRLSVAQVASSGPFSHFHGIDRHLIIIRGEGCILNGTTRLTSESNPYSFSGEEKIECELIDGPFYDFNVMVKKGWKKAIVSKKMMSSYSGKDFSFVYLVDQNILYQLENETISFPEQDAICVELI